jgi:hypothetical protein
MKPWIGVARYVAGTRVAGPAFPENGTPARQLEFLLQYAVLAPSGHNTQPWKFRIAGATVELYGDFGRRLPVADPDNRELVMSCGAALLNLRVAARNFGLTAAANLCPDPDRPDLLAEFRLTGRALAGRGDHRLFNAISERRTSRLPFDRREIPRPVLYRLQRAAAYEDCWMWFAATKDVRVQVADLIAAGDCSLNANVEFRNELSRWLRSNECPDRDGLPGFAYGLGDLASRVAPQIIRPVPFARPLAQRDRDLALNAPAFAVLGTDADGLESWMIAGQALGRILLAAQSEGLAASFFLQPIEIPDLRDKLAHIVGEPGYPQITFRLGSGPRVPPTPRRPLSDVLLSVEEATCAAPPAAEFIPISGE